MTLQPTPASTFQGNEVRNTWWWDPNAADYILEQILCIASERVPACWLMEQEFRGSEDHLTEPITKTELAGASPTGGVMLCCVFKALSPNVKTTSYEVSVLSFHCHRFIGACS